MSEESTSINSEEREIDGPSALEALAGLPGMDGIQESFVTPEEQTEGSVGEGQEGQEEVPNPNGEEGQQEEPQGAETVEDPKEEGSAKEKTEETEEEKQQREEDEIKSKIFGEEGIKIATGKSEESEEEKNKEVPDTVASYLKENLGIESTEDLKSKIEGFDSLTKEHQEITAKYSQVEEVFKNLPPELYNAVDTHLKGGNWADPILNRPAIDYSKEEGDINDRDYVEAYYKGSFSEEDWEEFNDQDGDPNIKKAITTAIDSAKIRFSSEKSNIKARQDQMVVEQQNKIKAFESSVEATTQGLTRDFEGKVDAKYTADVASKLKGNGLYELFYEKDGTLKPDAAKRFVMAQDGYDLMQQYKRIVERKAESTVRQEVLERGADTPPSGGSAAAASSEEVRPETKKYLDDLLGGVNGGLTY